MDKKLKAWTIVYELDSIINVIGSLLNDLSLARKLKAKEIL
jgi:hypothetical protein